MDTFGHFLSLLIAHGYVFMFVIILFEGPTITAISAFAAALGYFNIYTVAAIALVGNLVPDLVFYAIGYYGRESFVKKNGRFFGFKNVNVESLEKAMNENMVKGLLLAKLVPFLSIPGLVTAGVARVPFRKYLALVSLIILGNSSLFLILGYYFGKTYRTFSHTIDAKEFIIASLLIAFVVIVYFYKKIIKKALDKVEKI